MINIPICESKKTVPMSHDARAILSYRPDLDGLRAVAIMAVIFCHFFVRDYDFNGGMGVDMFFVLSGYLITTIITRQYAQGTFQFQDFYTRRIRRLFPTLVVTFMATWVWAWIFFYSRDFRLLGGTLAASGAMGMNYLLSSGAKFFHITPKALPYGQLWSLSLEEQFYLIFPWVLMGMTRISGLMRWRVVILMIVAALSWLYYFQFKDLIAQTYYDPLARSWELLIGVCLALSWENMSGFKSGLATIISRFWESRWGASLVLRMMGIVVLASTMEENIWSFLWGVGLIAVSFRLKNHRDKKSSWDRLDRIQNTETVDNIAMMVGLYGVLTGFLMPLHTYPVCVTAIFSTLGTALMIASGPNSWVNQRILSRSIFVYIGKISYALYVIHYPIYILCNLYCGKVMDDPVFLSVLVVVCFVLAAGLYRWIEKPTRHSTRAVWPWILAMMACVMMGYLAYNETIQPLNINPSSRRMDLS